MSPIAMSQCVECDSQSRVSAPHRTARAGSRTAAAEARAAAYGDASWRVAGGLGVGRKRHRPLSSQIAPAGRPRAAPLPRSAYADGYRCSAMPKSLKNGGMRRDTSRYLAHVITHSQRK